MLRLLWRVLSGLPAYLWSGWGAAASLLLLLATWEAVAALDSGSLNRSRKLWFDMRSLLTYLSAQCW